ncbi:hypothetical protein G6F37_000779 [Rhizopus arrhizus]|nr:hypothetical protein G6F38_003025 [Rhizopus arrhizus]KAG1163904.1 hypothetical protein G6F37_000779 [Rhizopus arrhizus]
MAWETIQQNHIIIQQENTKSLLAPPSLAYNSPLLSTTSFSSSVSTLSSIQSSTHAPPHSELFHAAIVQKQALKLEELRQDLTALNKKYVYQIERLQEAEQQRAQVEHELEDLSRQLFEQANAMVSKEKKKRYLVEQKLMNATRELKLAREELDNERAQLKELREKLERQTEKEKSETVKELIDDVIDREWLNLFKEFVEAAPRTPIDCLHRLSFLKLCFTMDVQPCLRSGFSKPIIKRLFDSIDHQSCFIEHVTQREQLTTRSMFVARFRPNLDRCYGCNAKLDKRAQLFRFKLKEQETNWQYIDQACRNRIVAVCDFYAFIKHVHLGLKVTRPIDSLFEECFKLRLIMFYARSGISIKH